MTDKNKDCGYRLSIYESIRGIKKDKMTKVEKQIEFLNRLYTNIEGYKSLRFQIPTTIGGLILAIIGFVINSSAILQNSYYKYAVITVIAIVGILGLIALRFVQLQYKDIAEDIHYLWEKLEMNREDFIKMNKRPGSNPKQLAPEIFRIGYFSILAFSIIGIMLSIIK